jgi:hypothetical protein
VHVTTAPATVEIGSAPPTGGDQRARRLLLHLDDLRVAAGRAAVFRVFVNRSGATAATSKDEAGFVEELSLVPSRSATARTGTEQPGQNLVLPLPAGLVKPGERITVTFVPVREDVQGQLTVPGAADITLKRPYITLEP